VGNMFLRQSRGRWLGSANLLEGRLKHVGETLNRGLRARWQKEDWVVSIKGKETAKEKNSQDPPSAPGSENVEKGSAENTCEFSHKQPNVGKKVRKHRVKNKAAKKGVCAASHPRMLSSGVLAGSRGKKDRTVDTVHLKVSTPGAGGRNVPDSPPFKRTQSRVGRKRRKTITEFL